MRFSNHVHTCACAHTHHSIYQCYEVKKLTLTDSQI